MKRGQISLGNAPQIVVLLGFTVMVAAALAIALNGLQTSDDTTGSATRSDSNSVAFTTGTELYFADRDNKGAEYTCTNVNIYNTSNAANVTSDYSILNCRGNVTNALQSTVANEVNYTGRFTTYTHTYNMTEDGERGLTNLSLQIPTVGTVIGVALIIVVIVGAFMFLFKPGGGL